MIRAIIFDCFGVLIEDALGKMREGLRVKSPEKAEAMVELLHASHHGLVDPAESNRRIAELLGIPEAEYNRRKTSGELKNLPLMAYINELRCCGYKTAILSNISSGGIDRGFTRQEIEQFDTVVASGDTGYAKPEAQIYEITADRLGLLLNECVFTDDNEDFCDAARSLGMQAILYKDFAQFKKELEPLLV